MLALGSNHKPYRTFVILLASRDDNATIQMATSCFCSKGIYKASCSTAEYMYSKACTLFLTWILWRGKDGKSTRDSKCRLSAVGEGPSYTYTLPPQLGSIIYPVWSLHISSSQLILSVTPVEIRPSITHLSEKIHFRCPWRSASQSVQWGYELLEPPSRRPDLTKNRSSTEI